MIPFPPAQRVFACTMNQQRFTQVLNCVRIHNVPAVNLVIIAVLATFLLKLTTKYNQMYSKSSLFTIVITNLVLYGLSELLAQTLQALDGTAPRFSVQTEREIQLDVEEAAEEDHIDRFIDFLEGEHPAETPSTPAHELAYFRFGRLAGFMCWGFVMAFAQTFWYKFLHIYLRDPKVIEVLRKVMSDQFCYSPVSLFCFFTYSTMVLESGTWEGAQDKLRKVYLKTLVLNWLVWFPVQFVNFLAVPRNFQVPFSLSVAIVWNCYLSIRLRG